MKSGTVTCQAEDSPPPGAGLTTRIFKEIFEALLFMKSLAGRAAVSAVELTSVVGRAEPFTSTTELELKLFPMTVKESAGLPSATVDGDTLATTGTGLFTVNVKTTEGLPPGFITVTYGVPAVEIALAGMDAVNVVGL